MATLLMIVVAYIAGSVPTGVWLARRRGVDPRDIGSGNIGATNVARAAGPAFGVLTLVGDLLKGLLPVLLATQLGLGEGQRALVGLAAFGGHLYPCFLQFRGGKGVATSLGILLGVAPLAMAVILPVFFITVAVSGFVSLGSLLSAALTPLVMLGLGYPYQMTLMALVMGIGIAVRHRDNIRRIRFGTESQVRNRGSTADSGYA